MIKKCKKGKCVPVASTDKCGNIIEVFCQNCTNPMTQREHKEYFDKYIPRFEKKFKQEYSMIRPNYDFRDEVEGNRTKWKCERCKVGSFFDHQKEVEHIFLIADLVYIEHKKGSPLCSLSNDIHMGPDITWETKPIETSCN